MKRKAEQTALNCVHTLYSALTTGILGSALAYIISITLFSTQADLIHYIMHRYTEENVKIQELVYCVYATLKKIIDTKN